MEEEQLEYQQHGGYNGGDSDRGGGGLFGDDDEDDEHAQQQQQQQYQDDVDADDILGLDDAAGGENMWDNEGSLLMRFCPHDSSMLYPKVGSWKEDVPFTR